MEESIKPSVGSQSQDHIDIEDLARLIDGSTNPAERQGLMYHLNRCPRCYEILQETLNDVFDDSSVQPSSFSWWRTRMAYALAASIFLVLLIGGQFVLKYWNQRPQVILATLNLDQELKDILLENDALRWQKGERVTRLVTAFQHKGLQVKELNLVVLSKPYYQKKSLFGPKEILHIRIENKTAYLEVKEKN